MANEADEVLNTRPSKIFRAIIEEETVAEFDNLYEKRDLSSIRVQ